MQIRRATVGDLDAIVDVASIVDPPADDAELDVSYYQHLLTHGRLVVAAASDIVIGYAAMIEVDGSWHVSDLFLHQDARGQDIGRGLLNALWDAAPSSVARQTFSSLHPAALPLYVRAGMLPRWPLLYLNGSSAVLSQSDLTVREVDADTAAAHEAAWFGWDRSAEYRYWAGRAHGRLFAVRDGESILAVGCTVRNRTLDTLSRLACAEGSMMLEATAAAIRWCGDDVVVAVPGSNGVARTLIDVGWRVVDHDLYCASEPGLVDPARLLPHPGLL